MREGFIFGQFDLPDDPYYRGPDAAYAFQPNVWPEGVPGLTEACKAYYRAVEALNARMLTVFAVALGLPADYFADKFDRHTSAVRLLHYPGQDEAPPDGQLRCSAHTDFGSHTILLAEDAGRPQRWVNGRQAGVLGPDGGGGWGDPFSEYGLDGCGPAADRAINCTNDNETYSFHPGGAVHAFADGSVRFVRESIPIASYARLVSAVDGLPVGDDGR